MRSPSTRSMAIGWLVVATLLLALTPARPAAAIDLSGDYVVATPIYCRFTFVQTGTALQLTGSCWSSVPISATGTVNPTTGAFSVSGELTGQCTGLVISGTGDGEAFTATYAATSGVCASGGTVSGTKCSNGVIDPGEDCEDGNALDGDCCSARCRFDSGGTACTSDGNVCTDDVCNPTGTCTHVLNTRSCDDGSDCTNGDVCVAGTCAGVPVATGQACASDGNVCTDDVCNATGTCTHVLNTSSCDDGSECTNGDVCVAGTCAGVPVAAGLTCASDGNVCTDDVCNATGTCTHMPNTDSCDDGNACSTGDVCSGAVCTPTGVAPACAGTFDATGHWFLSGPYGSLALFGDARDFTQTGAVLAAAIPGFPPSIGEVDPATGTFTANMSICPFFCCEEIIIGTLTPDGEAFSGTASLTCEGGISEIPPTAVVGSKCQPQPGQPCDEVILGSKVLIKDPTGVEDRRQVKVVGKDAHTSLPTPLAEPTAGATLTVVTAGTTPGAQTIALTGTWTAVRSSGWKYKAFGTSPVTSIFLQATARKTAQLKVLLKGNVGSDPLTLVPPNPGTEAGVILDDGNGTQYCVRLGGAAGGVVKKNDATQFLLVGGGSAIKAGCPVASTTTTPSTTTTTIPFGCDNLGGACGTSGLCLCYPIEPACDGLAQGACISNYSVSCFSDQDCAPGDVCLTVREGTDYCGGRCVTPCP